MIRSCHHCDKPFSRADLAKDISKGLEAERKELGVEGFAFRCYKCPHCGHENLFVDLHHLASETPDEFKRRREELEGTIKQAIRPDADVTLVEKVATPRVRRATGRTVFQST